MFCQTEANVHITTYWNFYPVTRELFLLLVCRWRWLESDGFDGGLTGNFTIDYLLSILFVLSTECQIYIFYIKKLLRATQTRVISHSAVGWHCFFVLLYYLFCGVCSDMLTCVFFIMFNSFSNDQNYKKYYRLELSILLSLIDQNGQFPIMIPFWLKLDVLVNMLLIIYKWT